MVPVHELGALMKDLLAFDQLAKGRYERPVRFPLSVSSG
jgi:hypothetical protein